MFFRKTTVDSIIAGFQKKIDQLRQVAAEQTEDAIDFQDAVNLYKTKAEQAAQNSIRAQRIAARLEALLND